MASKLVGGQMTGQTELRVFEQVGCRKNLALAVSKNPRSIRSAYLMGILIRRCRVLHHNRTLI